VTILDVTVPDIGDFKDVKIIDVAVKVGDILKPEDTLISLETDKATMDIPCSHAGVVKEVLVKEGDTVSEGSLILKMDCKEAPALKKEKPAAPVKATAPLLAPAPTTPNTAFYRDEPVTSENNVHAGPATRRLARELGIGLQNITGSGPKSRILTVDIHEYVKKRLSGASMPTQPAVDFSQWGAIEYKPLSRIKQLTAENLHRNWITIPHVTHFDEADITDLENFRKNYNQAPKTPGIKLTPLVFILKVVVNSLQQYPQFNSSLAPDGKQLILKKYVHIGVAVDTPNGLVVPVIRNVDTKNIEQLAAELHAISTKAREKGLSLAEMSGGCLTISSLGGIGGTGFTPIINAPEVAILGVSKAALKPLHQNQQWIPRLMLPVSLSYDHRVIDGAEAARFTQHLCAGLSDIRQLLL
jgi:pyruvate dehydrogenase E2 component (dihydrolipoamide acetyltransferase)